MFKTFLGRFAGQGMVVAASIPAASVPAAAGKTAGKGGKDAFRGGNLEISGRASPGFRAILSSRTLRPRSLAANEGGAAVALPWIVSDVAMSSRRGLQAGPGLASSLSVRRH